MGSEICLDSAVFYLKTSSIYVLFFFLIIVVVFNLFNIIKFQISTLLSIHASYKSYMEKDLLSHLSTTRVVGLWLVEEMD
jgi:hypothetical protein